MSSSPSDQFPGEEVLREFNLVDTRPEEAFDRIVDLASHLFDVPIALFSFLDTDRERIKASVGLDRDDLPRTPSFCKQTIENDQILVVNEIDTDDRFQEHPLVTSPPKIRFYAGAPVSTPENQAVGTIGVLDTTSRPPPPPSLLRQLETLALLIEEELVRRRNRTIRENEFTDLLLSADAAVATLDSDGKIVEVASSWERFLRDRRFQVSNDETTYLELLKSISSAPHTERLDRARSHLSDVLQGKKSHFELRCPVHGQNEEHWLHIQVLSLKHSEPRAIVIHTDGRCGVQYQQLSLLESAVEQASDGVLITKGAPLNEPGPEIIYINSAFTEITGYEPDEVIGKTPRLLQGPATEEWVLRSLRDRLEKGESFEGEAINYRKDGTPFVNHWSIAPVKNEEGTITHWVSVQRDVTEQRRMGERLLEAQEKERRRIAQSMHDEMGGLLASIQMSLDRARNAVDREHAPTDLFDALESQINALSDVVRTVTGQFSSRVLNDYGLSEAVGRMVEKFRTTKDLDVELHNEIEAGERLSSLIERVAYHVLREALSNVVQHADTDAAQVMLNKTQNQLRIHVIDDGVGFDPSVELHDEDNLGLSSIRERVERLNGTLSINAAPGQGTRLTITLPLTLVPLPG